MSKGDIGAMMRLAAHTFRSGDYQSAFNWFHLAAKFGDPKAMCRLAWMYAKGKGTVTDEVPFIILDLSNFLVLSLLFSKGIGLLLV